MNDICICFRATHTPVCIDHRFVGSYICLSPRCAPLLRRYPRGAPGAQRGVSGQCTDQHVPRPSDGHVLCHTRPGSAGAEDRRSQLREDILASTAPFFLGVFVWTGRHRVKWSSLYEARSFSKILYISWMPANVYMDIMGLNTGHK